MNVLIDIGHPGHVHFFKGAIQRLEQKGHGVRVVTRNLPVALGLLEARGIAYRVLSHKRSGSVGLAMEGLEHNLRLWPLLKRWNIDVCASIGGTYMVLAAFLRGIPRLVFSDTETARLANRFTFPFASRIITPDVYPDDCGPKHVRYKGVHELAYLHPDGFSPDPEVLGKYGLDEGDCFSIVRFCAWQASHDSGLKTAGRETKREIIRILEKQTRVLVIPEGREPEDVERYVVRIDPEDFHSLLYHAAFCVTEGATTATEAGILGVPTLYINPLKPQIIQDMAGLEGFEIAAPDRNLGPALSGFMKRHSDKSAVRHAAQKKFSAHDDVTAMIVEKITQEAFRGKNGK